MSAIAKKYIEKEKKLKQRKNAILQNEDYISWIEEYSQNNDKFTSDDSNEENIETLEALYLVIEEYVEDNYIFPSETSFGYYYTIKYNDVNYNIGYASAQGVFFFCEKTNEESQINFKDILEGKKQPSAEIIKLKLNKLNLLVNELSLTFPEEKLVREVKKVYQKRNKSKGR